MLPYCEYTFDITNIAKKENNLLHVEIEDISAPFGPVVGWENFGGIIRDVYVSYKNKEQIKNVFFSSELKNEYCDAICNFKFESENAEGCTYEIRLLHKGNIVLEENIYSNTCDYSIEVKDVKLWIPDEPNLYKMQIKLLKNGEIKDIFVENIGFREIKCERHRFLLNGKPIFLRGVCKHEMIGGSGHTVKEEDIRRDMLMIKELGCNFVRLVHYPHGKAVLDIADELGLMVSEEPGLWWSDTSDAAIADGSIEVLRRTIQRDRNHPSVAFWLCFNECKFTEDFLVRSAKMCKETDPTRLVSGANCMSDEDTLKYYNICGFDFYTMHPYSQTFNRSKRSAKILNDKPLVFTEWGGHFVYDNPKLMREFIIEMKKLYEKNSDDGALAGAFLWAFAEVNDFNREKPAVIDGKLLEGLVDSERNPELCFDVFREAWESDINETAPFEISLLSSMSDDAKLLEPTFYNGSFAKLKEELFGGAKPAFLEEQRPRVIKVGPVCEKLDGVEIYPELLTLCDGEVITFSGAEGIKNIYILGCVSATLGYPLSGEYGECAATLKVIFDNGEVDCYPIKNGIELTTVYATWRSSRIEPIAEKCERYCKFSYDKSFEQYVMNKLTIDLGKNKNIKSISLESEDKGYVLLTYGIFASSK